MMIRLGIGGLPSLLLKESTATPSWGLVLGTFQWLEFVGDDLSRLIILSLDSKHISKLFQEKYNIQNHLESSK